MTNKIESYSANEELSNKNIRRLLIAFGLGLVITFLGCNNSDNDKLSREETTNAQKDTTEVEENTALYMKNLILNIINPVPDTIDGCGDYYMYDSVDIKSEKYIFLSTMSEVAVISINNKIIYLNIDTLASETTTDFIKDIYIGNGIKAILNVKKLAEYSEGGFYKGELIIIKGSEKKSFKVHGTSGC